MDKKTASDIMKPIDELFMLDINSKLDYTTLKEIYDSGYSRIPIYEFKRSNIVGILMARDLILINPESDLISIRQLSSIMI